MKKISLTGLLLIICASSIAANIKLTGNAANCKKINGHGADDKMSIASKYKVSLSSVKFIGTKWGLAQYAYDDCILIFDTAKGPKECTTFEILSDDNGKTAFGIASVNGNTMCN
jgi:hypothetical protein